MAQPEITSLWWPEERIKATLDTKFIVDRIRPENVSRLFDLPKWGEGLTSETYMEWILLKAGRLFLILDSLGIPDRIFALVDESCDDDDLPIAEQNVDRLPLSPDGNDPALDSKFFHAQWRFCVRGIGEGEHVIYSSNEGVPVEVYRTLTHNDLQGRDDTADKVILAGPTCRVFLRTQVQVGGAPHFFSADEVLAEIRALRKLAHPHLISLYASYFTDNTVCALFTGAETARTLHTFVTDEPLSFKRLPKEERRQTLIRWPHCLSSALAWLHAQGCPHGAIRPSNILIDVNHQVCLGQFQALDSLLAPPRVNDLEAYQYSAPERWVRATPVVQPTTTAPARTMLPSGGRTAHRRKPAKLALATLDESPPSSPDNFAPPRPDSAASKGTVIRIGLPGSPTRFSWAFSSSSSSSAASISGPGERTSQAPKSRSIWSKMPRGLIPAPSITSASTSSSSSSCYSSSITSPTFPPPPSPSTSTPTPTSTSTSTSAPTHTTYQPASSPAPSDLFSLAAVILDILTHLCKRSHSSFTSHRSARNRSAGRGGGMADASFHLARNAVQVQSWIALLEGDALKRCRRDRDSDRAFYAVPRMLMVLRAMLAQEPEKRPSARRVQKSFAAALGKVPAPRAGDGAAGIPLHCALPQKEKEAVKERREQREQRALKSRGRRNETLDTERGATATPEGHVGGSSESMSEFEFGFSDGRSDSGTNFDDQIGDSSGLEEEDVDLDGIVEIDRLSPQLSLPDLDVHISGIEALAVHDK
ncbi:hypothetical protein N7470_002381 [Penicillium chermesinum]|nr:hypothetical protein N7470_002381 [Penicillium chermesinum]